MSVSEPGKIITPWAESGLKNPIPPAANQTTGRAGFDQGFSAINMTAKEAGGIPPFGQDFNGIFYEITNILRYMQAGGQPTFSSALATAIGGYPKGAMVLGSDGVTLWQSKIDSNLTDPNTDPANWGTFDIGLKADLAAPGGAGLVGGLVTPITWSGFSGGADPTGLVASDAAFASANSSGSSVFFPAGTYRISSNSSLADCEVWFEMGASISVDAGATLTIGRVRAGTYRIFDGAGMVKFTNQTVDVYPEWFGAARGIDSTPFITKCLAACSANKNTVRLTNAYLINDLLWDSRVPVISDRRVAFTPTSTAVNGVTLTSGNAGGMCLFPTISGFSGFGFKLLGTDLANIKIVEIRACTDALVLETSGADVNLLDNEIQLTAISMCTNGVVFVSDKNSNVMQGNRVYCNFITSVKNSVLFRGNGLAAPGPNWDSNKVVTQAIDPTASVDAAAMLKNENTYAVSRFVFRVETWAGGLPSNGKYIDGIFNGLDAYFNLASTPLAGQINYRGVSNKVDLQSTMGLNTTGIVCSTTPENLAGFNDGKPLFENVVKLKYVPTSNWTNNTQRVAFLYHMLTDAFTNTIYPMPGENGSLRGVVFDQIVDNSNTTPYEIRVHLRNVSGATIPAGTEVEFKLRIGLF